MAKQPWKPRTLLKYALFQLPALFLLAIALLLIEQWIFVPRWLFWTLLLLWAAKDALLYPWVWRAYGLDGGVVGRRGVARTRLAPSGEIWVGTELWQAELITGSVVEPGQTVRIRARDGLTLKVEPEGAEPSQSGGVRVERGQASGASDGPLQRTPSAVVPRARKGSCRPWGAAGAGG
jgi:membrane protein implicated in regulation of membrane protease activity